VAEHEKLFDTNPRHPCITWRSCGNYSCITWKTLIDTGYYPIFMSNIIILMK